MIRKFLCISTANLTNLSCDALWEDEFDDLILYFGDTVDDIPAIFVHVPCEDEILALEVPEDIKGILMFARRKDCDYVMVDRDADVVTELPFYYW